MSMGARLIVAAALTASAAGLVHAAPPKPAPGRSTHDGVYSQAQARKGALAYATRCAMCHGARLQGTLEVPALQGKFIANWARSPLAALYNYIGNAMPQHAPGSLAPADRAALVAYLLESNGYKAGLADLPADPAALGRISFAPHLLAPTP